MEYNTKVMDVFFNLLRHWVIILLTAILFAVCSFLYTTYCVTNLYYSRGSLYVNSSREKTSDDVIYQELLTSKELINTYIEVLRSDHYMDVVAEISGLEYTGKQMKKMVSMASLNETEVLEVYVFSPDPKTSQKIIQTVLDNAGDEMNRVIQGGSVQIVDNASYNSVPASPNVYRNVFLAFVIGLLFSSILVYYFSAFDTRIMTEFDCKNFNLPILGEIPGVEVKNN